MYTGVTNTMVGHLYQAHPVQIGKAIRDLVKSGFTIRDWMVRVGFVQNYT